MRKINVEVTYYVEIETDEEFKNSDEVSEFVGEYLCSHNIEEIGDSVFSIVDYGGEFEDDED